MKGTHIYVWEMHFEEHKFAQHALNKRDLSPDPLREGFPLTPLCFTNPLDYTLWAIKTWQ